MHTNYPRTSASITRIIHSTTRETIIYASAAPRDTGVRPIQETWRDVIFEDDRHVESLAWRNPLGVPVFVREGTILKGQTQPRMVAHSTELGPRQAGRIEVRCVDVHYPTVEGVRLTPSGRVAPRDIQAATACGQHAVWRAIEERGERADRRESNLLTQLEGAPREQTAWPTPQADENAIAIIGARSVKVEWYADPVLLHACAQELMMEETEDGPIDASHLKQAIADASEAFARLDGDGGSQGAARLHLAATFDRRSFRTARGAGSGE